MIDLKNMIGRAGGWIEVPMLQAITYFNQFTSQDWVQFATAIYIITRAAHLISNWKSKDKNEDIEP